MARKKQSSTKATSRARVAKPEAQATTTKVCTRCKKRRKLDLFYRDKSAKDGRSPWCRPCESEYAKEYRARKQAEASA